MKNNNHNSEKVKLDGREPTDPKAGDYLLVFSFPGRKAKVLAYQSIQERELDIEQLLNQNTSVALLLAERQ